MAETRRERARAEVTAAILEAARRQLAEVGAQQLSLRGVARDVGLVSSAVYRYFPSRDDLLTRLIMEAYSGLADRVEEADARLRRDDLRGRWRAACSAVRDWARENPHEYALVYGSPVPGYAAPVATVEPATRVSVVFLAIVAEASAAGRLDAPGLSPSGRRGISRELLAQLKAVSDELAPGIPPDVLGRVLMAWTQLFGMVSFELFGHLVGSVEPAGPFFEFAVEQLADFIGLPPAGRAARGGRGH
ncbi:MAG: TetR/AcrR family transcriptional regulator [Actinomycetes bacterium]